MDNTKLRLRSEIRAARKIEASGLDLTELFNSKEFQGAQVVASYRSYGDEPSTVALNEAIRSLGKNLLLPVLNPDLSLSFAPWNGDPRELKVNGNFEEPIGAHFAGEIDLLIVPALAIDKSGNRLGQGGGSYDRTLARFSGFSVALINASEFLESLPSEPHDQRVSAVLAGSKLMRF